MAESDKTKKWLEWIIKLIHYKAILKKRIEDIIDEHDSLYEPSQLVYGKDLNVGIKTHQKSDRTGNTAIDICENLPRDKNKLQAKLMEVQAEIEEAYETLCECLSCEEADMKVEEFDVLYYFYFEEKRSKEIQKIMHYSDSRIRDFKREGTDKLHTYKMKLRRKSAEIGGNRRTSAGKEC